MSDPACPPNGGHDCFRPPFTPSHSVCGGMYGGALDIRLVVSGTMQRGWDTAKCTKSHPGSPGDSSLEARVEDSATHENCIQTQRAGLKE